MARVTVEDCILSIPNRFDLVITAAQRAKQIASGSPLTLDRDNDKDAVVALREIADETIDKELVQEEIVQSYQKQFDFDRNDRIEGVDLPAIEASYTRDEELFGDSRFNNSDSMAHAAYTGGLSFIEDNVEVDD